MTLPALRKVSDETFFLSPGKWRSVTHREPEKRGGSSKSRGIGSDQVAVVATQDRKSGLDLCVATMGGLKKVDIEKAIGSQVDPDRTILCSNAHVSHKGFAIDDKIEHHPLKAIIKQLVKGKVYHIQHVNSTHNRVKKWVDNTFWGVSTKYSQQYLNRYRIKERPRHRNDKLNAFADKVSEDITAYQKYLEIETSYEKLLSTQ